MRRGFGFALRAVARIAVGMGLAAVGVGAAGAAAALADPPTETPLCAAPFQGAAATAADPGNPLGLSPAPSNGDPLEGTHLYVPGPGYGHAAGAIAQLLHDQGASPKLPADYGNESWADFRQSLESSPLAQQIAANPTLKEDVPLLEKIADQPETARFSMYSAGGGPGAVYSQVQKYLCRINPRPSTTPPYGPIPGGPPRPPGVYPALDAHVPAQTALPLISTYFLVHQGACATLFMTPDQIATFKRQVREFAHGLFGWAAVVLIEIDALDTAPCLSLRGLAQRLELLRWMVSEIHADDPHVVQYVEGGADDAECVQFAINALKYIAGESDAVANPSCAAAGGSKHATSHNRKKQKHKHKPKPKHKHKPKHKGRHKAIDARTAAAELPIRGFFVGDTHFDWTIKEIGWGAKIAAATGLHFIVATQDNGNGPDIPAGGKVSGGNEVLCNPAGAGLGIPPTPFTGFASAGVDAFEWSGTPGLSGGNGPGCNGVTTPPGLFDLGFALRLSRQADLRLGPAPTYPAQPY